MQKDVSSHAQSNGAALVNSEMVEKSKDVHRALAMCNPPLRIVRSTMATSVGFDDGIFSREGLPASVNPIFVTSRAAVQEQQGLSTAFDFIRNVDVIDSDGLAFHVVNCEGDHVKKQSSERA